MKLFSLSSVHGSESLRGGFPKTSRCFLFAVFALAATLTIPAHVSAAVFSLEAAIDGAQANAGAGTGSPAAGTAAVTYDDVTGQFSWVVEWSGLLVPASVAHFHGPATPGQNAGVQVPINPVSPSIGSATISAAQSADLLAGLWYVNIHTPAFPGGEIRGQLRPVDLEIEVAIDIKFCSDPNSFNCKKKGVLPVTIFGTDTFDVADIDVNSLQLCTEDLSSCTNGPRNSSIEDRGNPNSDLGASMCALVGGAEQDYLNMDGFLDLDVGFEAREIQDMLAIFCEMEKNAVSEPLIITGSTIDGTPIYSVPFPNVGIDQLRKVNKKKKKKKDK